jgi:hypothetical protein
MSFPRYWVAILNVYSQITHDIIECFNRCNLPPSPFSLIHACIGVPLERCCAKDSILDHKICLNQIPYWNSFEELDCWLKDCTFNVPTTAFKEFSYNHWRTYLKYLSASYWIALHLVFSLFVHGDCVFQSLYFNYFS